MLAVACFLSFKERPRDWGLGRWLPTPGRPRGEPGAVGSRGRCPWEPRAPGV